MTHPEIRNQRAALLNAQAASAELGAVAKLFEVARLAGRLPRPAEANQVLRNLPGRG